jgi:hypothetical protein
MMETNPQIELAMKYVEYTGRHIFLTGKAGTGKTTFLHRLREDSHKRMVVVAPTGVAAINAHGVTIHSFFQLAPGSLIGLEQMKPEQMRFNREKVNIIRSLDLLVIDEISMVRADLLDAIDIVLRRFRYYQNRPFGGVQLLMIGDLQQLSPVVKDDERDLLYKYYDTPYFFSSKALRETAFTSIELTHVFRQQDDRFIAILNKVRTNQIDRETLDALNERYLPDFHPDDSDGYITLCTHNAQAQRINESKLNSLAEKTCRFTAEVTGTFPEYTYPTDYELALKLHAQVMFVKNDTSYDKRYYNGKVGTIVYLDDSEIRVLCPDEEDEITVTLQKWDNVRYRLDDTTHEIREEVEGSFTQMPLRLAWAITIHKSQGLTFEHAVIDAEAAFAHGQVYVALSRCKTLEGMALRTPIRADSIINDQTITGFTNHLEQNQPDEAEFQTAHIVYQQELVAELFRFQSSRNRISYINKIVADNKGSIAEPTRELFRAMLPAVQTDVVEMSERFQRQIAQILPQQPDVEKNPALQERIMQASKYFLAKLDALITVPLAKADLDIDNKAVKKQLIDAVDRLDTEIRIKTASLQACLTGFDLSTCMHAKAVAAIGKEMAAEKRRSAPVDSETVANPVLFEQLRVWRMEKAGEMDVPPYVIFTQRSLYGLTQYLPADANALSQISGFGQKRIKQFGAGILEIISAYCKANAVAPDATTPALDLPAAAPVPSAESSHDITFRLFLKKTRLLVDEIAAERDVKTETIAAHLVHFIAAGRLDAGLIIDPDKLETIVNYFRTVGDTSISAAKTALGDDFTYSELRIAAAHLQSMKNS